MREPRLSRPVSFHVSPDDRGRIVRIARRGRAALRDHGISRDQMSIEMDLSACHANGCPLDLRKLEEADDFNLVHDLLGIARHLDHATGALRGHFHPRCALREQAAPTPAEVR